MLKASKEFSTNVTPDSSVFYKQKLDENLTKLNTNFSKFKSPCELVQVLLKMLVTSFSDEVMQQSTASLSYSPMALAVQLVTAITVIRQSSGFVCLSVCLIKVLKIGMK